MPAAPCARGPAPVGLGCRVAAGDPALGPGFAGGHAAGQRLPGLPPPRPRHSPAPWGSHRAPTGTPAGQTAEQPVLVTRGRR